MKQTLLLTLVLALASVACFGQGIPAPGIAPLGQQIGCGGGGGSGHRAGALFYAACYASYQAQVISGITATGAGTIQVFDGGTGVTLSDGSTLPYTVFFNTNTPITVFDANTETVTPSAVSVGPCTPGFLGVGASNVCAFVTATFANTHGAGANVYSGDAGIEEAITDAGNLGGGLVYWITDTGIVTLNTGSLTTTTTTNVPATFYNAGCSGRVTTTITTSANWAVGVSGSTASFCAAQSSLTAGTVALQPALAKTGSGSTALTAVLFTLGTSNPGAGALKARVWGWTPVSATQ
jgi:hypothetical protein